jgi:hypothetical protein
VRTKLASFFSSLPLGSFAALEIPQPDLDGFPRNFCPADLRIFSKDCGRLGILNFQTQNLNDTVIDLNVCHGHPPLREQCEGQLSTACYVDWTRGAC